MEKSAIQILLRSSLFSYAATAVFLLLLAFGMYRFQWGEKEITLGVRGIYILACFLAGLSRRKESKKAPVPLGILRRRPLFSYFSSSVFCDPTFPQGDCLIPAAFLRPLRRKRHHRRYV